MLPLWGLFKFEHRAGCAARLIPCPPLVQERALGDVLAGLLVTPWVEAVAAAGRRAEAAALAQGWVCYLSALRAATPGPGGDPALVEQVSCSGMHELVVTVWCMEHESVSNQA